MSAANLARLVRLPIRIACPLASAYPAFIHANVTSTPRCVGPSRLKTQSLACDRSSSTSRRHSLIEGLPTGIWDSHMHVVDPRIYALSDSAQYTPQPHTVQDARAFEDSLGIEDIVLVQPSIYGNDNTCLLDALRAIGPRHARGVVQFDPESTSAETLLEWHALGVRGVRLNFKSVGVELTEGELRKTLLRHADAIRDLGWAIELYIGMESVPLLERTVPELGVNICIAHFAHPALPDHYKSSEVIDPYSLAGFESLARLLKQGSTWVKFSGAYRIETMPEMRLVEPLALEILRIAEDRALFATDWPHTRFDGVDITPFMQACLRWCQTRGHDCAEKLFRKNAEVLWGLK